MQAQKPPTLGQDADQRKAPVRGYPAGAHRADGPMGGGATLWRFRLGILLLVGAFIVFFWIDEYFDLPGLIFGRGSASMHWGEPLLESLFAVILGLAVYGLIVQIHRRFLVDEQERKREKILSDIIINESPTLFQAFNPDGSIIVMSRHTLDVLGYSYDEAIGKDYLTLIVAAREREALGGKVAALLRTGVPARGENHLVAKDGREILVQWEARAAYKDNGEVDFVYGPGYDITERKALETALRQSEERYLTFIRNLQGIAYQGDMNFTSLFIYGDVEKITGYTTEEFTSQKVRVIDIIHPEDLEVVSSAIEKLKTVPNHTDELVYRIIRKDGEVSWVSDLIRNICDESGVPSSVQGIVYDITREKASEDALRRSEARYRLLAENAKDVIWATDSDLRFTYISPSSMKLSGYTPEEVGSQVIGEPYTEESNKKFMELLSRARAIFEKGFVLEEERTAVLEAERYRKDGSTIWVEITSSVLVDEQGKPIGLVGATQDITTRKRAEEELRKSEERYRLLAENITDVIWAVDRDLKFTYVSPSVEKLRGYTVEEILALPMDKRISGSSRKTLEALLARAADNIGRGVVPQDERTVTVELELPHKDGGTVWVEVIAAYVFDGEGRPNGAVGMGRDITERKRAEEMLRESEELYRLLAENITDVIWMADTDFRFTYISPSSEKMNGYTAEELMSMPVGAIYTKESQEVILSHVAQALEWVRQGFVPEGKRIMVIEAERYRKDGSTIWVEITTNVVLDKEGRPTGLVGVTRDITERKRAEDALQKSEARYRLLAENITDVIWSVDENLRYTYISPSVEKMRGYTAEEAMALPLDRMYTPASLEMMKPLLARVAGNLRRGEVPAGFRTRTLEVELFCKDGSPVWAEVTASYLTDREGKPTGVVGVTRDMTARKRTEEALQKSDERYRLLAENITDVIWAVDENLRYTFISPSVERVRGYTVEEALALPMEKMYAPGSLEMMRARLSRSADYMRHGAVPPGERTSTFEVELNRKDGSTVWTEVMAAYVFDREGKPTGVVGVTRDITARRQAEEALLKSEERYRLLAEHTNDVVWVMDDNLRFTYLSPSAEKIIGYTVEEILAMPMEQYLTERSYQKASKVNAAALGMVKRGEMPEHRGALHFKVEVLCRDGSAKWAEIRSVFMEGPDGKPVGAIGVARDITERIKSENALRQSETTYRSIFESTGTAMAIVEEDGTLSLVNEEFEKISGFSSDEIEGVLTWRNFVSSEDMDRLASYHALRKADPEAAPRNYEFRLIDRYGMSKDMFTTSTLITGTKRVLLSLQDITQSKVAEEELRVSQEQLRNLLKHAQDVRERERTRVAREIHDELGQVLTGLKMDLSFLAKKLPPDLSDLVTKTNLMLRFVDMTIQSVKRITMDLRPGLLDHLGLVAAIEWQADEFQKRTGIRYHLSVTPEEIILEPEQSTAVFRIFQETLTNIAKYAHATEVKITLVEKGGRFKMTVADNGVGITKEQMENPKSFGLMGIQERAYFSGGTAKIFGQKGKGTTVTVTIPIDQMRSLDDTSAYRG